MNFIINLSESNDYTNLLIITDRLSKNIILISLTQITAEEVT